MSDRRRDFVERACASGANKRALMREFAISPATAYKWLKRVGEGETDFGDRSRRPHRSPGATAAGMVEQVLAVRRAHPAWGGRKIHHFLRLGGVAEVPHANTITGILRRHGLIDPLEAAKHRPFVRFEAEAANDLWQMDFKGHFAVGVQRCHPLGVIDDHSRYALTLGACPDERRESVQHWLIEAFRAHGLPRRMLMDNGPPWGKDGVHRHTRLTAWLMRLGIKPLHGRPHHPQTQGKTERFNGTLKREVIAGSRFVDLPDVQRRFDCWREVYNTQRPHQAIGDLPPATRYRVANPRPFPDTLPPLVYPDGLALRRVQEDGRLWYGGRAIFLSGAFAGETVALRPTSTDGVFDVLYAAFVIDKLDCTRPS